jgi:hypothetical protein
MTTYTFVKNPIGMTKFLKIMLWFLFAIGIISFICIVLEFHLLASLRDSGSFSFNDIKGFWLSNPIGITDIIISNIHSIAYLITAIAFLKWVYLVYGNALGFGTKDMTYTAGWAVASYFIPLYNIFVPYHAMKEVWQVSKNPENWKNEDKSNIFFSAQSQIIAWWWCLNVISIFLAVRIRFNYRLGEAHTYITNSIVHDLVNIPLFLLSIALVSKICMMQQKLVKENI